MADFGRLANEISIQYHQEQERLALKNSENLIQSNQNFFVQTSSIKSNRLHTIVSCIFSSTTSGTAVLKYTRNLR